MSNDRYASWGALGGLVATILIVGGFAGLVLPNAPNLNDPATAWSAFFADHRTKIQFGVTVLGVGLFFFIWFLGTLRSALGAAEGGQGRLASIAFGGGIVAVVTLLVAVSAGAAAALRPTELDPNTTRALNDLGVVVAGPGAAGFTALFAATAIAGYRFKAIPAPVAGMSALAAITQPLAYGVAVTDTGVFAADGFLGGFVPIITFVLAMVPLSLALYRQPAPALSTSAQ